MTTASHVLTPTAPGTFRGSALYVSSADGLLTALRASDGQMRTQVEEGNQSVFAPLVHDGVLYFGVLNQGDSTLVAWNPATQREVWRIPLPGYVESPPVFDQGMLYIVSNGSAQSPTASLYALDAARGVVRWHSASGDGYGPPAVGDGVLYAPEEGPGGSWFLAALRGKDGAPMWKFPVSNPIIMSPVLSQGTVFAITRGTRAAGNTLQAIRTSTGTLLWHYDLVDYVRQPPAIANGALYVSSQAGELFALRASDGKVLWEHASLQGGYGWGEPLVADGVIYVGAPSGLLYGLDAATGSILKTFHLDDAPQGDSATGLLIWWTTPVLAQGVIYIGRTDLNSHLPQVPALPGDVYAVHVGDGTLLWTHHFENRVNLIVLG